MENTLENKAKVFAQYWGQKVLKGESETIHALNAGDMAFGIENNWLQLKPLSSITEEDLYFVGQLFGYEEFYGVQHQNVYYKANQIIKDIFYHPDSHCKIDLYLCLFDYLRSKGYALPWMGLSVEEQIKYGWVKLV